MGGLRQLVPVFTPDEKLLRELSQEEDLVAASLVRAPTWTAFDMLAAQADALLLDEQHGSRGELDHFRLLTRHPSCVQVVLSGRPSEVGESAVARRRWVVPTPASTRTISQHINRARFTGWHIRVRHAVLGAEHIPYSARLSLLRVMQVEPGLRVSVTQAARELRVSRSHLSRLLAEAGIEIGYVADGWVSVQAAMIRWHERRAWDSIAWQLGYSSLSGLADTIQRARGMRLRDVNRSNPEAWPAWFEGEVLAHILRTDVA